MNNIQINSIRINIETSKWFSGIDVISDLIFNPNKLTLEIVDTHYLKYVYRTLYLPKCFITFKDDSIIIVEHNKPNKTYKISLDPSFNTYYSLYNISIPKIGIYIKKFMNPTLLIVK